MRFPVVALLLVVVVSCASSMAADVSPATAAAELAAGEPAAAACAEASSALSSSTAAPSTSAPHAIAAATRVAPSSAAVRTPPSREPQRRISSSATRCTSLETQSKKACRTLALSPVKPSASAATASLMLLRSLDFQASARWRSIPARIGRGDERGHGQGGAGEAARTRAMRICVSGLPWIGPLMLDRSAWSATSNAACCASGRATSKTQPGASSVQ